LKKRIFFFCLLFIGLVVCNKFVFGGTGGTDRALKLSTSGILAQKLQLRLSAENIANASTLRTANGRPYQKKYAIFMADEKGVRLAAIKKSTAPFKEVYDPANPLADPNGFVYLPNVDVSSEMVQITLTNVLYEANTTAYKSAKSMYQQSLDLLK
jgi:flagellar basal-body rod protein FlgC